MNKITKTAKPRVKPANPATEPEPSLGPGPTLDQPTAPSPSIELSADVLGILSWIDKEEVGERDKLAALEALAERQRETLRNTLHAIEQSKAEIQMAQGSRFAVAAGARAHHGVGENYELRGGMLTCLPE